MARNKLSTATRLPSSIQASLRRVKSRIRQYVLLEGLALLVGWFCLTFLLFAAADYLPVRAGFQELPVAIRGVILVTIAGVAIYLIYQLILRRLFVRLKNRSMALLLERAFPEFQESLITTVEAAESTSESTSRDSSLLQDTKSLAESTLSNIDVAKVFNRTALNQKLTLAGLAALGVAIFAIGFPESFKLAGQRLFQLSERTWPRLCQIEIVGIKVKRDNLVEGIPEFGAVVEPSDSRFRVAKGSSVSLLVRAQAPSDEGSTIKAPSACEMRYQTSDGNRGRQMLKRIGTPRDGFQLYSLDGQPLQGILSKIEFTIRGGDHRVGPISIEPVDAPTVVETQLECVFPRYLVDESSGRWTPRSIVWSGHSQLPQGTNVKIHATSNKPLEKVYAYNVLTKKMQAISVDNQHFVFPLGDLNDPANVQFFLCDTDQIISEQPHSVTIQPIEDVAPVVNTRLDGIGTAITPDAIIPLTGNIKDDYEVAKQWVTLTTPLSVAEDLPFRAPDGEIGTAVDLRKRRQRSNSSTELPTGDDNQLELIVQAQDKFDLRETPNIGLGDRYVLDLVTPGELLRILERLEVGHRKRLEMIYDEVTDARGYLVRTKAETGNDLKIREPGETDEEQVDPIRKDEMRLLFTQRSILQIEKSQQEVLGIALEFDSIRKQLINNRVDSKDRVMRLSDQIVAPLNQLADQSMQQLMGQLEGQETMLLDLQKNATDRSLSDTANQQSIQSLQQIDIVLNELDRVLSILVKYETQNELLDIVRQMIKMQTEINERTTKENKRRAFDQLLDLD